MNLKWNTIHKQVKNNSYNNFFLPTTSYNIIEHFFLGNANLMESIIGVIEEQFFTLCYTSSCKDSYTMISIDH